MSSHTRLGQALEELAAARRFTDAIFASVDPSAMVARPIGERHRVIFYLGHLEAFDWNLVGRDTFGQKSRNASLDQLFAFGIDPTDGNLPGDTAADWPSAEEVQAYGGRLRQRLDELIQKPPAASNYPLNYVLQVAVEHRWMHAETLLYMLHQLPVEFLRPAAAMRLPILPGKAAPDAGMVPIAAGETTLGQRRAAGGFGWDNEFEAHTAEVNDFRIETYPVTHHAYQGFVDAGGYSDPTCWRPEDWRWLQAAGVRHPRAWRRTANTWRYRTLFEEIDLPAAWPVHVSFAEAQAYARWSGKQLPSEAQWQRAAYGTPQGHERLFPWGEPAGLSGRGNFHFRYGAPTPVDAHPAGASAFGVQDLLGNGWEWTRTPFAPLPGFAPMPFYTGYSANFFDAKHFVLKGGSHVTAASMLRRSFRNWFQPHYPFVYASFRCVEN